MPVVSPPPRDASHPTVQVQLLRAFDLRVDGRPLELPAHARRVLAYLGVHGRSQQRQVLAERLWLDSSRPHALASLRTAVWLLNRTGLELIRASRSRVELASHVEVDLEQCLQRANGLLIGDAPEGLHRVPAASLMGELLPDWDEDWLTLERERLHQLRIHALELLARRLLEQHLPALAIEAAHASIAMEPLRESAQLLLIEAHLAEGNQLAAKRALDRFALQLRDEGLRPSEALLDLVRSTVTSLKRPA